MANWGEGEHGAKLCELFNKKLADPTKTKADEIDRYWKLDPCFGQTTMGRPRDNYRKTAAEYTRGVGLSGIRCAGEIFPSATNCPVPGLGDSHKIFCFIHL